MSQIVLHHWPNGHGLKAAKTEVSISNQYSSSFTSMQPRDWKVPWLLIRSCICFPVMFAWSHQILQEVGCISCLSPLCSRQNMNEIQRMSCRKGEEHFCQYIFIFSASTVPSEPNGRPDIVKVVLIPAETVEIIAREVYVTSQARLCILWISYSKSVQ